MAFNIILGFLVLQIVLNIDKQIEHIRAPRFMPSHLHIKPSYRYRNSYWFFTGLVIISIMSKDRGLTLVEHLFFVIFSLCLLIYAPFWLLKAIDVYEE